MATTQSFTNDALRIDVEEAGDEIVMRWFGKSTMRKPSDFLAPILADVLKQGTESDRRIVLDFRTLQYMNSSTITPVIRILERIRRGQGRLSVLYLQSLRWQHLSFSALKIFETPDGRIEIKAVS